MKRKILITISFVSFSILGFSQEIKTLFSNDSLGIESFGGYGSALIHSTQINNAWGIVIGGKGGVVINKKFAFGGVGKGLVGNNDFLGNNLNGNKNTSLRLNYGAGGLFFEYLFKLHSPIHFSIPINFMAGGISVNNATSNTKVESSGIFIIEPGVNLEFNFSKYFIPAINISYRQAFGISLINLTNQNVSGVTIGLLFKFGYF